MSERYLAPEYIIRQHEALSACILAVKVIIKTSQFPESLFAVSHYLQFAEQYLKDAVNSNDDRLTDRLFELSNSAIMSAKACAEETARQHERGARLLWGTMTMEDGAPTGVRI